MIPVIEESFWVVVIHEGGIDVRRQNENAIHGVHSAQPWLSLSRIPSFSLPEVLAADCLQQHDGPCLYSVGAPQRKLDEHLGHECLN